MHIKLTTIPHRRSYFPRLSDNPCIYLSFPNQIQCFFHRKLYMPHNATISTLGFCNEKLIRKCPFDPVPIIARWHFSLNVSTTSEKAESHGLMDNKAPAPITPKFLKNSRLLINASFIAQLAIRFKVYI